MAPPSAVWLYFKKVGNNKVRCSQCQTEMMFTSSTSSLAKHLRKVHRIELPSSYSHPLIKRKRNESLASDSSDHVPEDKNENEIIDEGDDAVPSTSTGSTTSINSPSRISRASINGTLDACFAKAASFARGGKKWAEITDSLLYMIAVDMLPLSLTEKKGFQKFIKNGMPQYHPPTQRTITNMMEGKYSSLQIRMKDVLASKKNLVLTTDLWTESMTTKSYVGLTVHYLEGIEMKSVTIGAKPMPERKTIENLSVLLTEFCSEWGIEKDNVKAVITDNGANIVGACERVFGAEKHIACFAHNLNIVAMTALGLNNNKNDAPLPANPEDSEDDLEDDVLCHEEVENEDPEMPSAPSFKEVIWKIKKIVAFFRRSERATEELKELQKKEWNKAESECLKLIQAVKTRWNSVYEMLERFLLLSDFVGRVLIKIARERTSKEKAPLMITPDDEELAGDVKNLLEPLWEITMEVCAEKSVTLSKCIPLASIAYNTINDYPVSHPGAYNLKTRLLTQLETRFRNLEKIEMAAIATILDPRFKKLHFQSAFHVSSAVSKIGNLVKAKLRVKANPQLAEAAPPTPVVGKKKIWLYHNAKMAEQLPRADHDAAGGVAVELRQYLNRPVVPQETNPYEEWVNMRPQYPHLYKVAMEYLPILATSVPSERLFSKAGLIVSKLRNRLSGRHVNQLVFLASIDQDFWFSE